MACRSACGCVSSHAEGQQVVALSGEVVSRLVAVPEDLGAQVQQNRGLELTGVHVVVVAGDHPGGRPRPGPVTASWVERHVRSGDAGFLDHVAEHVIPAMPAAAHWCQMWVSPASGKPVPTTFPLARLAGIEPATNCLEGSRSIR
jgi:hypothetical protein